MITDTYSKKLKTVVNGIGEIEVEILQIGEPWWLKEIETFIRTSNEKFFAIIRCKPELNIAIHFQRVIQAFISHIQSGGEEQVCRLIQSHFRNWINKQNLKTLISAHGQPNSDQSKQSVREGVQSEFNKRYGI